MPEEPEKVEEQALDLTESAPSKTSEALAGEESAPLKTGSGEELGKETTPHEDQDIELEIGGKVFSMKQSEAISVLENASKIAEREQALSAKEKSFNQYNTQEGQRNAEFRKSIEKTFGYFPDQRELAQMGKLVRAYSQERGVKQVIDQILNGSFSLQRNGPLKDEDESGYAAQLQEKVNELEERLGEVTTTFEERDQAQEHARTERSWNTWVAKKAEAKVKITEEIESAMVPFIRALKDAHPEWDDHAILDEALEHTNLKDLKRSATTKVFKSAEEARKGQVPRITPRQPARSDADKTYAEIIKESA